MTLADPSIENRRVLYVFLASPSDLTAERRIVRELVHSLNRAAARPLSLQIELLGWEDTMPGVARPQALINEEVDRCALFIGMLGKRWGSPTGEYTSGFEEEFRRAEARNRDTGSPQMWLFFKSLIPSDMEDVGPQLQQVITFREEIVAKKTHLFKEFSDAQDLQVMLNEYLLAHLLETPAAPVDHPADPDPNEVTLTDTLPERSAGDSGAAQADIQQVLQAALGSTDAASVAPTLSPQVAARLTSFAHASFFQATGRLLAAPHVALELYRNRRSLTLTSPELEVLLYEILPLAANTPGWFWFDDVASPELASTLHAIAANPQQPGAVRASATARYVRLHEPGMLPDIDMLNAALDPEFRRYIRTWDAVAEARIHLVALTDDQLAMLVEKGGQVAVHARGELLRRTALVDPEAAFKQLASSPQVYGRHLRDALLASESAVDDSTLQLLAGSEDANLRKLALSLIAEGRTATEIGRATAEVLLADAVVGVRQAAAHALHRQGVAIPDDIFDAAFRSERYDPDLQRIRGLLLAGQMRLRHGDTVLSEMVTFANASVGEAAYRALLDGPDGADRARRDLRDRFVAAAKQSEQRLKQVLGDDAGYRRLFRTDESVVKNALISAALTRLIAAGDLKDAPLARELLADPSLTSENRRLAISLLAQVGDWPDLDALIQYADRDQTFDLARSAQAGARNLLSRLGRADVAGSVNDDFLREIARARAWDDVATFAASSLYSPDYKVRRGAAQFLCATLSRGDLEELLDDQLQNTKVYLDVVADLDEHIYFTLRAKVAGHPEAVG